VARKVTSWYISLPQNPSKHARDELKVLQGTDGLGSADNVFNSLGHRPMGEENTGVALAGGVALGNEGSLHELRSVGYEVFEFAVDGIQGKNCAFADVRMSMFEACRYQWLQRFSILGDFL
jgi:hypothetical protein